MPLDTRATRPLCASRVVASTSHTESNRRAASWFPGTIQRRFSPSFENSASAVSALLSPVWPRTTASAIRRISSVVQPSSASSGAQLIFDGGCHSSSMSPAITRSIGLDNSTFILVSNPASAFGQRKSSWTSQTSFGHPVPRCRSLITTRSRGPDGGGVKSCASALAFRQNSAATVKIGTYMGPFLPTATR